MADGENTQQFGQTCVHEAGHILLWRIEADGPAAADRIAEEMGRIVDHLKLGTWGYSPVGLAQGVGWFDVVLDRQVPKATIWIAFGAWPIVY